jgi:precorrin-6B methylase 2
MSLAPEPGSFRDPDSRVFYYQGEVYRALSQEALEAWRALQASQLFARAVARGSVVATEEVELPHGIAEAFPQSGNGWAGALRHQRIPFVSYPYEWTFGMLRDAALLQLELLEGALAEGTTLKDASPYNIQWQGAAPVFVDLGSFAPHREGDPWVGYLQFCQLFLYPLLLTAYRDLPYAPWLRGQLDGITPEQCDRLLGRWRDRMRPGVFADVFLQARFQAASASSDRPLRSEVRRARLPRAALLHNVRRLKGVVSGLRWKRRASEWSRYGETHSYQEEDLEAKRAFVSRAAASRRWGLAWDLGCNTGAFTRAVAEHADYAVAMDADHLAVEILYRELRREGQRTILPLVCDLLNPSPDLGWRRAERRALEARGKPDLVLCLALAHHLVLGGNVPLTQLVEWLAGLGGHLVIELVTLEDPMAARLVRNKEVHHRDYTPEGFEAALARRFAVLDRLPLGSGTRVLYFAHPLAEG